ncbi:MAG: polysaccharide pyruvyl transferase CsaB [Syntrophomonadaceae bacterium]|jgi:polysaccharide pyruvyl transferase CsaB
MKICLSGYYGFDNAGDEALLSAITSTIRQLNPAVHFVVFSGYPGKTAKLHGLTAVNRINPWSVMRELSTCDLLISGGGSLFQDVTGPFSLPYYIGIVALAKLFRKPVIFYAQGIGPINRWWSKVLMRLIANHADIITLRDHDSLKVLGQLGITRPPVRITADPVFSLEPDQEDLKKMEQVLYSYVPGCEKIVGVSVRKWSPLSGYESKLASVLDRLADMEYKIVFIPLDYPDDLEESRKIMAWMQRESILLDIPLKSKEHVAIISQMSLVVGMRLHSLIFAASRQVPFIGISYDPKIDSFLKMFGLSPLSGSPEEMLSQIMAVLEDDTGKKTRQQRARELREKAIENAHMALSLTKAREN